MDHFLLAQTIFWKYGPCADLEDGRITVWRHKTLPQPDRVQLKADMDEFVDFQARNLYREKRAPEYPPVKDGLDALVQKELGDPQPWLDYVSICAAIKSKYPKPKGV